MNAAAAPSPERVTVGATQNQQSTRDRP